MRLQVGRIARRQQLVHGISIHDLMQALDLADLKIAGIALVFYDILLRAVRQRNHAAVRILNMQVASERNHRNHVKIAQVINQTVQFVSRHGLVKKNLIGLSIDHMRAIKGHQQTIMVLKVELLGQGVKTPCGTPRSQNELNTRLLRRKQLLARTRADHLLVVGERTVDIHCDGFNCHMCLLASFSAHHLIRARARSHSAARNGCKTTPFETKAKNTCKDAFRHIS